eukprot:292950_1
MTSLAVESTSLFSDFTGNDIATIICIFIGAMAATGGGLGGGGIFVPVYILILQLTTTGAAALSQATIFGGAVVNLIMNLQQNNPERLHRPLIYFSIILIFEPLLLVGTTIGVILNAMFPGILILILLILVLAFGIYRTTNKGIRTWKKETKSQTLKTNALQSINYGAVGVVITSPTDKSYQADIVAMESKVMKPMIIIIIVWVVYSLGQILKTKTISGVTTCSTAYWLITILLIPVMMAVSFGISYNEMKLFKQKTNMEWKPANGDIEWNIKSAIMYPIIGILAGIMGGLLGIGGGMIVSPLLMELNVLPTVNSATTAVIVLIISSSSTLQYLLMETLNVDYMFFFMAVGVIATLFGKTVITFMIKKYGRKSLVMLTVAAVMTAAVILMAIDSIKSLIHNASWEFTQPC